MNNRVLSTTDFVRSASGWIWPDDTPQSVRNTTSGLVLKAPPGETAELRGPGVHTRNGDSIELSFRVLGDTVGQLTFGFDADRHEHARVEIDLSTGTISFVTSEWTVPQPVSAVHRPISPDETHTLTIEKNEGGGNLIKNADVAVHFDGERVMSLNDQNLLPEMGVHVQVSGTSILLEQFVHRGIPSGIPEYLHLGGWQMLNVASIEENMQSLFRGIRLAAEQGIELLVTPEASMTGLFPISPVTKEPGPIAEAEIALRHFISDLPDAPHVVVGLPIWRSAPSSELGQVRYIGSRVYDPQGDLVFTGAKVHSAEQHFWHGYSLNEFNVKGVPISMHICHDHRYPELQTLPVMFGARLVLHPSNGNTVDGSVSGLEAVAESSTSPTHAFYMNVNAGGGSYIAGPQTKGKLIVVSDESSRDNLNFPMVGEPVECLFSSTIRVHDAFGYWPTRSFRASETIAHSYVDLYRALGGSEGI